MEPKLPPADDPTSIGNILIDMGVLDRETLQRFVEEFKQNKDELLGEFICRKTKNQPHQINESMIELALMKQRRLRGNNGCGSVQRALEAARNSQMRVVSKVEEMASITYAISTKVKI